MQLEEDSLDSEIAPPAVPPEDIRTAFKWDSAASVQVLADFAAQGGTKSDLCAIFGYTPEELEEKFAEYPEHAYAFMHGPTLATQKVASMVYDRALSGSLNAASLWLRLQSEIKAPIPKERYTNGPAENAISEIEAAQSADEISLALRKHVAKATLSRVISGEISGGELVKLLGMVNDRIDGKVVDRVEHSGSIDLAAILKEISGTTAGLPKQEWIDGYAEIVQNEERSAESIPDRGYEHEKEDKLCKVDTI